MQQVLERYIQFVFKPFIYNLKQSSYSTLSTIFFLRLYIRSSGKCSLILQLVVLELEENLVTIIMDWQWKKNQSTSIVIILVEKNMETCKHFKVEYKESNELFARRND